MNANTERIVLHFKRLRCPKCDSVRLKANGSPKKGGKVRRYSTCQDCGQRLLIVVE